MKNIFIILILFNNFYLISQEINRKSNIFKTDSIELTELTREVYRWYFTNNIDDFPYKYDEKQDSIFIGMDWGKYQQNIEKLKKTNYFTHEFYLKHREIASTLDLSIKKADIYWRNINDGIPLWQPDADFWCECQDYPDDFWCFLTIDSLNIMNNKAEYIWTWDKVLKSNSQIYKITAKKENNKWKINSLDGFKYFFTFEEYEKIMKNMN